MLVDDRHPPQAGRVDLQPTAIWIGATSSGTRAPLGVTPHAIGAPQLLHTLTAAPGPTPG